MQASHSSRRGSSQNLENHKIEKSKSQDFSRKTKPIEQLLSTPNGTIIQYTDDPPEYRQELLKCFFTTEEGWNVSVRTVLEDGSETASSFNDGKEHYMYSIWRKA